MAIDSLDIRFSVYDNASKPLTNINNKIQQVQGNVIHLNNRLKSASLGTNQYGAAVNDTTRGLSRFAKSGLQQAGYQVGDFAVQVAGGTSAIQAFGQQGSQLLGIFGATGAILGALVAIVAAVGTAFQKSGKDLSVLTDALGTLTVFSNGATSSLTGLKDVAKDVVNTIVNNFDMAIIAGGLFAAMYGVKVVKSLIMSATAATAGTVSFAAFSRVIIAGAFGAGSFTIAIQAMIATVLTLGNVLKSVGAILMRFAPTAIFAGLVFGIQAFLQLVKGAGSFGAAIDALLDVLTGFSFNTGNAFKKVSINIQNFFLSAARTVLSTVLELNKKLPSLFQFDLSGASDALDGVNKSLDANKSKLEQIGDVIGVPKEALEKLAELYKKGATDIDLFNVAVGRTKEQTEALKASVDSISQKFGDAFRDIIKGTKSMKDAFKSMAMAIIDELINVLIVKQLVGTFDAATGKGTGIAGAIGKVFSRIPGFANGGMVSSGKPVLVGEKGAELFIPHTAGRIEPNNNLGNGQVVVNQTINVSTGVQQTVRNEIQSMLPQIANASKAAVLDARRRGGSFANAF